MARQPTLIASVQRALNLLDAVGDADRPLPAKTLARRTGQPLPTTYHLLRTLVHEGYLRKVPRLGYVLGERVGALSSGPGSGAAKVAAFHPILEDLHRELSAAAYLSVLVDGEIRLADVVDSVAAPRVDLWVGFHEAAHATALGKAVLSALEDGKRRDYLAGHGLADLTPHTVTDRSVLLRQLAGGGDYCLDREEYALGTACVAAAVPSSSLVAAVAVSVPAHQVQRVVERGDALRRAARSIAYAEASS
jgi:IclR family transcriptional regulator, acetate operon repressor